MQTGLQNPAFVQMQSVMNNDAFAGETWIQNPIHIQTQLPVNYRIDDTIYMTMLTMLINTIFHERLNTYYVTRSRTGGQKHAALPHSGHLPPPAQTSGGVALGLHGTSGGGPD